ncbi:CCA tRNA nucleotidyltransferase [Roseobacter sp.]|uniref:CCA tRNA nucleotidyltransferase n=1 Tax=Roseobacter sp. TaxID=1907202 RepID=UPI0025F6B909|nr:CCA tRNA nucleotidyltransferase [Roseobacter sp.]
MDRADETLIPPATAWLHDPATRAVCDAITAEGAAIYFVGGAVRDALLGVPGADVDLSTDVLPEETERLAKAAGLRTVPTGIEHGTVTVISQGRGFEVTTFRRDVETDGRRAVVSFSRDIHDDARRRDFTLNALYATPDGGLVDPLGGLEDCLSRRIRFIEDAEKRIREDYLRILRYFRFHAWYSDPSEGFDTDAMDAITRNIDGLETLSAERTGTEMRRLLAAPDPAPAIAAMRQTGALLQVLPGADDRFLAPLVHLELLTGQAPDAIRRLAALEGEDPAERLRLSRKDTRKLAQINRALAGGTPLTELAWREGVPLAFSVMLLLHAMSGTPPDPDILPKLKRAAEAVFPVTAADLMPAYKGPALGERLKALEARWIASGFRLSREDLMTGE